MKYTNSEIYYNDGGHCGPFKDFSAAYTHAVRTLKGSPNTTRVEIRPRESKALGGYASRNDGSFYVTKNEAAWSSAVI